MTATPAYPRSAYPWKVVWITGASSGIGRQLALDLAAAGVVVAASARSADALAELATQSPRIRPFPLDVTDADAIARTVDLITQACGTIDLAILNAGVWLPMWAEAYDAKKAMESMRVNYFGIANAVEVLIPKMIAARRGHLALTASVAGYRGLPQAAAYAPSKAAVIALAEVLKLELGRHSIDVSVINPGFVDTPMTSVNKFSMPFRVTPAYASTHILSALRRRKFDIAFPWQMALIMKTLRLMPDALFLRLARRR